MLPEATLPKVPLGLNPSLIIHHLNFPPSALLLQLAVVNIMLNLEVNAA